MVIYRRVSIRKYGKSPFSMGKSTISYYFHGHRRELAKSSALDPLPRDRSPPPGLDGPGAFRSRECADGGPVPAVPVPVNITNWTDLPLMMGKSTMSMAMA